MLKELLKLNLECGIKEPISAEIIEDLADINPDKRKLIYSVKMSLTSNKKENLQKFIKLERERIQLRQKAEEEKREEKKKRTLAKKKKTAKYDKKSKNRREISKYGKSEFFK